MRAPIRLQRERPAVRQAGGAIAIGAFLTLLGGGMLLVARNVTPIAPTDAWLPPMIGAAFALVGVVMLVLGLKMSLSLRLPETIVEVDGLPVRAGHPFQVTVHQPGPLRLASLRVNVVGEQITRYEVWRKGRRRIETDRHLIHQHNIVAVGDLTIARGEEYATSGEAVVPRDVKLVDIDGTKTVVWRLEVWGRVRGWVNFGHPFVIEVTGVK